RPKARELLEPFVDADPMTYRHRPDKP
ncbi:MAG: hypothetical protein RL760_1115, partial [Candidatus Eisenbacteria bacterium]